jgi:hypothetical protein
MPFTPSIDKNTMDIADAKPLLKKLKDNDIYPIARIVTFKDLLTFSIMV